MVTDKIHKGAGSHRILLALIERERTSKELKKIVGSVNGMARFELEYMGRLEANGYVHTVGGLWFITAVGRKRCKDLERKSPESGQVALPRTFIGPTTDYQGPEQPPVFRPGAMDFLQFPSRRGNRLYYRDGRVVIVEG
jgi:hypothetical protein